MSTTTITISAEVKRRLAQAKGDRSWDDFLREVADDHLDVAISIAEERLAELQAHKVRGVRLADIDALRGGKKGRRGRRSDDKKRAVAADHPSRSRGRTRRAG